MDHDRTDARASARSWLAGFLMACLAGLVVYYFTEGNPWSSDPPPTTTRVTVTAEGPEPELSSGGTTASAAAVVAGISSPAPQPEAAPKFSEIAVKVQIAEGVGEGDEVGPALFKVGANFHRVLIIVTWQGLNGDGTAHDGDTCQILATLAGPQEVPAARYSECTSDNVNAFSRSVVMYEIDTTGDYSVKVSDELTGVSGTAAFTVID